MAPLNEEIRTISSLESHQSFFASRKANTALGYMCGILTFTPYEEWRKSHGIHHNTAGDLDRRGKGDVWTLTTNEFNAASKLKRFWYRFFRNPLTIRKSLRCLRLKLWDEKEQKLVGFRSVNCLQLTTIN